MGFNAAYLRASLAASAVLLAFLLLAGLADPEYVRLADLLALGPVLVLYVFGFTLLLGSIGLRVVQVLGWERLPCYAGVGFVLGAGLAGVLFVMTRPLYVAGAALLFGVMGSIAASLFWHLRRD